MFVCRASRLSLLFLAGLVLFPANTSHAQAAALSALPKGRLIMSGAQQAPPLPLPAGDTIVNVPAGNTAALRNALAAAKPGTTIYLEDGAYNIDNDLYLAVERLTLRSRSGNREAVILDGNYRAGSLLNVTAAHVTIADLTVKRAYYHPVHVKGGGHYVQLYNLHIVDGRQQQIKVNPGYDRSMNDYGTVAYSLVELTAAGRQYLTDHPTPGYAGYTGGIDAISARGWVVRDNIFRGIYSTDGGVAQHAVSFWRTSRDPLVERNLVVDCARGIGFGLGQEGGSRIYEDDPLAGTEFAGREALVGHIGGLIANNVIYANIGGYYDSGIGIEQAFGVKALHNTIYSRTGRWNVAIDVRFSTSNPVLQNNLYFPSIVTRDGSRAQKSGNIAASPEMFVNLAAGDLHLVPSAQAVNSGVTTDVRLDLDGEERDARPDVGADEYLAERRDSQPPGPPARLRVGQL